MTQLEDQRALGRAHVLDVRGASEFAAGHVPDAMHVPHTRIGVNLNTFPTDKPLLALYCNSGARAAAAVAMLERLGATAIDVNGPFANYRRAEHLSATCLRTAMTPEATTVASPSIPAAHLEAARWALQTIEERTRTITEIALTGCDH